jgi:ribosomal protein S18 acetylase RimI-like enzyme
MNVTIRKMQAADKPTIMEMMRVFYASPAVFTDGSEEIFASDVENCVNDSPYLDGYVLENEKGVQGYAMVAKSFSTEFGKPCMWIEDLYIRDAYRGQGLGKRLMDEVMARYTDCIFRLEVEDENKRAIALYEKCGFTVLPYREMKK